MVSNGAAVNATPKRLARFNAMKRVTLDQFKDSPSYVTRCQPKVEYGFERATCGPRTALRPGNDPMPFISARPGRACGLTCFKQAERQQPATLWPPTSACGGRALPMSYTPSGLDINRPWWQLRARLGGC